MVTDKHNECRLLDGSKCSYFVVVAVLLTFIHKCKPSPGEPLAERRVSPLVCFGLPVQGHAKKAKSTQKHGPPQAPGAAGGAHLSTPCDPGHPTVSGSTHRVVSNRDHSFPKWIHSPSDVGTKKEPIHFTQDDHHSRDVEHGHPPPHKVFTTITEGETITRCPHWFPDSRTYRRRTTKERSGRTKSPFQ